MLQKEKKKNVLAVDGKKIAAGLNAEGGDIDLWGYEAAPTLTQSQEQASKELQLNQNIYDILDSLSHWSTVESGI